MTTQHSAEQLWDAHWASAVGNISSSAIRELLKVIEQPGVISFAGGLPAPECFPAEEIGLAAERVLAREAGRVLQYGPTEGFPPLRDFLVYGFMILVLLVRPQGLLGGSKSEEGTRV